MVRCQLPSGENIVAAEGGQNGHLIRVESEELPHRFAIVFGRRQTTGVVEIQISARPVFPSARVNDEVGILRFRVLVLELIKVNVIKIHTTFLDFYLRYDGKCIIIDRIFGQFKIALTRNGNVHLACDNQNHNKYYYILD